jgi:hypothetical protein
MINLKTWLVSVVTSDAKLQGYLTNAGGNPPYNIYPMGVDNVGENLPAITFSDVGITLLSVPRGMHVGRFQLDIWSKISALENENIYARLAQVLNYQNDLTTTTTFSGNLWWIREEMATDTIESNRRLWRKIITYKIWASNPDLS